jgi:hypothetical protein
MRSNLSKVVVLLIAALIMMAYSEHPKTVQASSDAAGAAVPVSGRTAFWAMYKSAYSWSSDVVPLKLESKSLPGIKNEAGRAAMWSAIFGSPRRREAIEISYAVAAQPPEVAKGINIGHPISWAGPSREVMPFQGSDIVVDSDLAYKTAAAQAESWLKAHPDKPASFLLGYNPTTFTRPVWYVVWGDKKSGYRVFLDAKTGEVAKALK